MSRHEYLVEGNPVEATVEARAEDYSVRVGDATFDIRPISRGLFSVMIDGRKKTIAAASSNGKTFVDIDSVLLELKEPSEDGFSGGGGDDTSAPDKIFAPMPGKIVKLMVKVGQKVEPKQQAVIVEAMKMENPVMVKARGTVTAVNFAVGDQVDTDSPIIELELEPEE
jgi:biotin carboxyl carrier protein